MLVQKLRLQRGWSQQQLAELSGLSTRTIQRIENGQSASMETLKSLAAVFEVDFAILQPEPDMKDMNPGTNGGAAAPATPEPSASAAAAAPAPGRASIEEELALAHVRRLRAFYGHAIRYVVVVTIALAVNFLYAPQRHWALWVAVGWGIGLAFHAARAFELLPWWRGDWERRQVEKRLGRPI